MKLKSILEILDSNVEISIEVKNPPPYDNHEYFSGESYYDHETIFNSLQSYYTSIFDILSNYGDYKIIRLYNHYGDIEYLVIEIEKNEYPDSL